MVSLKRASRCFTIHTASAQWQQEVEDNSCSNILSSSCDNARERERARCTTSIIRFFFLKIIIINPVAWAWFQLHTQKLYPGLTQTDQMLLGPFGLWLGLTTPVGAPRQILPRAPKCLGQALCICQTPYFKHISLSGVKVILDNHYTAEGSRNIRPKTQY